MQSTARTTIALLRSNSLANLAQQEIERAILTGEFAPGSKLSEIQLAQRLGVSRGPIREAFRLLDEGGLIRTEKNRGVFVRDMSVEDAVEVYAIRAALEEMVGRHLAVHISAAQTKELKALVEEMKVAVQDKDAHAYHLLNLRFHERLVEMTGNRRLSTIYQKLSRELALFRRLSLHDELALPASAQAHRNILKAIASGDPELAGRTMAEHVTQSKERMLAKHRARSRKGLPPQAQVSAPEAILPRSA